MAKEHISIKHLAKKIGIDTDEALLILWEDVELATITDPEEVFFGKKLEKIKNALSMPGKSEAKSLTFWQDKFAYGPIEFKNLLSRLEIPLRKNSATVPKGYVKKLKNEYYRLINPVIKKDKKEKIPPLSEPQEWRIIGRASPHGEMRYLTEEEVLSVHYQLVDDFKDNDDPIDTPGPRDNGELLSSATHRPKTSFGTDLKYPTIEMAGAALFHSLVHNHPFNNGNKRTGIVSVIIFLDENRLMLICNQDTLLKFIVKVGQHRIVVNDELPNPDEEVMAIAEWILSNTKKIEIGERVIPFRRLKQVLSSYGCIYKPIPSSKMMISREIPRKLFRIRTLPRKLRSKIPFLRDGREVDKNIITTVRKELELDEIHGIDSNAFYQGGEICSNEFIIRYRKLLHRLSDL